MGEVETILEPDELRRYADAIVKASLGVGKGDFLLVQGQPEHREIVVATAEAGYRAGATIVDVCVLRPARERAHSSTARRTRSASSRPWAMRRMRELVKPRRRARRHHRRGRPRLSRRDRPRSASPPTSAGVAAQTKFYRRANLDLNARWTGAAWPTDYWASQVYPELAPLEGKRRLAQDFLWFCRLTDDGRQRLDRLARTT